MGAVKDTAGAEPAVAAHFREAFKRLAATVTVLTYEDASGRPMGMTATAVCSLSMDPLSLVACVNRATRSHDAITDYGRFGVNLLAQGQESIAHFCSRPGSEKSLSPGWLVNTDGSPALGSALAYLDCRLARAYVESTHSIFIGHVDTVLLGPASEPLLYCNCEYRNLGTSQDADALQTIWDRVALGSLC